MINTFHNNMFIFFLQKTIWWSEVKGMGGEGEAGKAGVVHLRSVIFAQLLRLVHSYD